MVSLCTDDDILIEVILCIYIFPEALGFWRRQVLVLVLVLIKDDFFIKRMLTQKASVYPGFIFMSVFTS